jgi:hypothetical protein
MAQAAFEFSPCTTSDAAPAPGLGDAGFAIGWDHARHRITPPPAHLHACSPVAQGWLAGRSAFIARPLRATAAVRQWLALRLQAWQDGAPLEDPQVNPSFLSRIDADVCPVSRLPLMLGTGQDDDATVVRLNPAAAYAAGNLAVVSHRVAQAWAGVLLTSAAGAADAARSAAAGSAGQPADPGTDATAATLDDAALERLRVLASFATPLPHAQAAWLPLRVLPPNRVRVINPVQALQVMLTLQFSQAGYARRLLALAALVPGGADVRQAFQIFMHTLLARRLAVGPQPPPAELRQAMEDTWGDVLVQRRWQRLASRLDAADCERLLERAGQRGLVVGGGRWMSADAAVEGWALPTAAPAAAPTADRPQRPTPARVARQSTGTALAPAWAARPGNARNRGSQNAAS